MRFMLLASVLCLLCALIGVNAASASGRTIVVSFSDAVLTVYEGENPVFSTKVVLPKGNFYPVPVSGTVTRAEMGPTWVPTRNMHRDFPGRYKTSYGPYESGNAMGHCKVYIDFKSEYPIMRTVRIHGNAKAEDLGRRRSRSCVRILDALCGQLVALAESGTPVHFVQ
jgi:lipoprotein-anchoring transpeptidase ErfK/SrfK